MLDHSAWWALRLHNEFTLHNCTPKNRNKVGQSATVAAKTAAAAAANATLSISFGALPKQHRWHSSKTRRQYCQQQPASC